MHAQTRHMRVANTMAAIRENWWIPPLGSLVKKQDQSDICKVFSTKPYGNEATSPLSKFRAEVSRPFQHTGVDLLNHLFTGLTRSR